MSKKISQWARVIIAAAMFQINPLFALADDTSAVSAESTHDEVVVSGEKEKEQGGTKTDAPLLETPQAVSVVTRERMDDEGARKTNDVLKNVAGVMPGGYYSDWDYYRIRGFDSSFYATFDGIRGDYALNSELFGLEKVEVIKGPISSLYGQGPLGGMINYVSKRPRAETFADVQTAVGSFNLNELGLDVGAPLNEPESLYYRLISLQRDQESFVDYVESKRILIDPSLTWNIAPRTKLTFLTHYQDDNNKAGFPLPAVGTVLPNINGDISISRFIGETGDAQRVHQSTIKLGYDFEHGFNDMVTVRQKLRVARFRQDWDDILYASSLEADERTLQRYPFALNQVQNYGGADTNAEIKFGTGEIKHDLLVGVDYYRDDADAMYKEIDYSDPSSYIPLDLFNPVYGQAIPDYTSFTPVITKSKAWGGYLQDQTKIKDKLTLTVGGRFDKAYFDNNTREFSDGAFSPRAGVTYEFIKGAAAYANYTHSFNPQFYSTDESGNPVDPETGNNWETGLKVDLPDDRLDLLVAVFHLTRQNVATANIATADPFDSIASGEQRSQGVEVEGTYRPVAGWEFGTAYAYTDAEITEDNTLPVGARLAGVSKNAVSARMKYTIQNGALHGLGAGLNGRYYSDQEGDSTYTEPFTVPGYALLDIGLYYKRGRGSLQANLNNVFDKRYFFGGSYNRLYVLPGEPFNASVTAKWTF